MNKYLYTWYIYNLFKIGKMYGEKDNRIFEAYTEYCETKQTIFFRNWLVGKIKDE